MVRYFLQLRDHTEETLDPEGVEVADLGSLQQLVLLSARNLIGGDVQTGRIDFRFRIDAENEGGEIVHTLALRDALQIIDEAA